MVLNKSDQISESQLQEIRNGLPLLQGERIISISAEKRENINGLTDLLAQDIREVLHYLGEITGEVTTDEILGNIFKNFCIGK